MFFLNKNFTPSFSSVSCRIRYVWQTWCISALVRKIVGIENEAVNKIHAQFLAQYNFSPKQEEFIKMIISYVRQNGDVAMADLINKEPFKRVDFIVLFGDKTKAVYDLVNTYHQAVYSFATA